MKKIIQTVLKNSLGIFEPSLVIVERQAILDALIECMDSSKRLDNFLKCQDFAVGQQAWPSRYFPFSKNTFSTN